MCVCTLHQNVKLMMVGAKLHHLTDDEDVPLQHYRHCLAKLQCNPPSLDCLIQKCNQCPFVEIFQELLLIAFTNGFVDKIEYRKWSTTDRSTLETIHQSVDELIQSITEHLQHLILHDFIAKVHTIKTCVMICWVKRRHLL